MVVLTEGGVERIFIPGNELPRFWEGKEVLPVVQGKRDITAVPIEVET